MPALQNLRHEKFCMLMADGMTYTEAYKLLWPNGQKWAAQSGYLLCQKPEISARVAEIREEVALRSVMTLSRKREVLRQMAEGMIPTKVFNKDSGETFDRLAAVLADAKLAGELTEKVEVKNASDLKLLFNVPHRDVIDAEVVQLPAPAEPQSQPGGEVVENEQSADLTLSNLPIIEQ